MKAWEYKIVDSADVSASMSGGPMRSFRLQKDPPWSHREHFEAYFNRLGADGWEVVNVVWFEDGESFLGLAKRER